MLILLSDVFDRDVAEKHAFSNSGHSAAVSLSLGLFLIYPFKL